MKDKDHREQIEADIRHKVRIEETERMRIREEIEKDTATFCSAPRVLELTCGST